MRGYPVRTVFYSMTKTEGKYNAVIATQNVSFITGSRPVTVSYKDRLQGNVKVRGDQQFLYVRKNPKTLAIKVGDQLEMPSMSDKTFKVLAIDSKYADLRELMLLVDALEA